MLDAAGTTPATFFDTGFFVVDTAFATGFTGDFTTPFFVLDEGAGDAFFVGATLEAAAFFTVAPLLAAAFFTGAAFVAAAFFTGAFPAAGAFFAATLATVVRDAGLAGFAVGRAAAAVFCPATFFAAGFFTVGLAAVRATVFAGVLVATGLAVFLAALTAFFADFLAATKRSSLDSPGPGKRAFIAYPAASSNLVTGCSPGPCCAGQAAHGHGPPAVRQGTWPAAQASGMAIVQDATDSQRPILR